MKQVRSNVGIADRGGKKKARNSLAWLCGLMALAPCGGVGAQTLQSLTRTAQTGYMVEVHTCPKADSGTDSLIEMEVDIRDPDWNLRTLKGWTQDHTHKLSNGREYNDHERDKWDRYFFPESTPTAHIEGLWLRSDGEHNKPGWCWDSHYVTRIENGQSIWTWAYEEESPWIYGGWYNFNFTYGDVGRPIPANLRIPQGAGPDKPPAIYGSIKATASYDTLSYATCFDETFRLATTGESKRVMRWETLVGNGYKKCDYTTIFDNVTPGSHRIERLSTSTDGSIVYGVVDCKTVTVTAGNQTTATIRPNWGCPQ